MKPSKKPASVVWFARVNKMQTITLSKKAFDALVETSAVVSTHRDFGAKVFQLPDGDYVKVFNPKQGLTLRKFFPKYQKFIRNAQMLKKRSIPCPTVINIYYLNFRDAYAVRYKPLPGQDVRALVQASGPGMIEHSLKFITQLHSLGVYFRGLHLGNLLQLDNGDFGLIDMTDLAFKPAPLNLWYRARNIAHLLNNRDDKPIFDAYGVDKYLDNYCNAARFSRRYRWIFMKWVGFYRKHH